MIYLNQNHIDILTKNVPCPERLNLELTTQCNLKCIMCRGGSKYTSSYKTNNHLTTEEFIKILEGVDLNRLKILNLAGNSEPLLNPWIIKILEICRELKITVEMITNGMLLTPEVSNQLIFCSSEIHVSFGGATKEMYESIRQGADFDLICKNIRYLHELKIKYGHPFPKICLNPILIKRNIHELPEIINLAKKLGCDRVDCSHLIVKSPELITESLFFHQDETNDILKRVSSVAQQNNIATILPPLFSDEGSNAGNQTEAWKICRYIWNHAILGIEALIPCGSIGSEIDFDGNVINNRFMDIWNNDWYANMRYSLLTGNPPDICKKCKDPSVKDVNSPASYFSDELLPNAFEYSKRSSQIIEPQ